MIFISPAAITYPSETSEYRDYSIFGKVCDTGYVSEWVGVELRHLAAFAAVAEEQSFRGAADRLGYVQSAVSQRISQLELAVGVRLVERSRGHKEVHLTEAGQALLRHAERIETHLEAARPARQYHRWHAGWGDVVSYARVGWARRRDRAQLAAHQ